MMICFTKEAWEHYSIGKILIKIFSEK